MLKPLAERPSVDRGTVRVPIGMYSQQLLQGRGTCGSIGNFIRLGVLQKGYMASLCEFQNKIHLIKPDFRAVLMSFLNYRTKFFPPVT